MNGRLTTPEEAYSAADDGTGQVMGASASFVCPYCAAFAQHLWGTVGKLNLVFAGNTFSSRSIYDGEILVVACCQVCKREAVFLNRKLIAPNKVDAPLPSADIPQEIASDFEEARQIAHTSPRGAAALLRLAIQKLCPILGATKSEINAAIGELVLAGKITADLQRALDSVRVIGNEAVHPGVMDLQDDLPTVLSLFHLVNFVIEKGITEPKKIAEIYGSLPPNKLAGIVNRDADK